MTSEIKAVVFDIGNVLVEWHPSAFYDARIGKEARSRLFSEVPLDEMNARVDLGANLAEEVATLARKFPQWADEIRDWHACWLEICSPCIGHSVRLLQALKCKDLPVFALTNFGDATFEIAREAFGFFDLFDRAFVSARLGVMKPDPGIYDILEAETGLSGSELIFTDDSPANIKVAEARGWKTHLFDGPVPWAERLVAEGLLGADEAAP